jgi:ATP-dependent RNA helicase DHX37/DHR1
MKLLTAISMYNAAADKEQFCKDYFLRPKAMFEVSQLQRQLTSIIKANHPTTHLAFTKPAKLSSKHIKHLNAIAASGYTDQVAIRADLSPNPPDMPNKPRRAIDVPYLPLVPLSDRSSASLLEKAVFIHPSSVLARQSQKDLPAFVVYSRLQKSQAQHISTSLPDSLTTKTRMFPLTPIDRQNLVELARETTLLKISKPLPNAKIDDIKGTPKRRECWVSAELRSGSGFGWPMPPVRVRQVMDVKTASGWKVEAWL